MTVSLTFTRPHKPLHLGKIAAALKIEDTTRFTGTLQYQRIEEDGATATWRFLGPYKGRYSPVAAAENINFLFGDARVVVVRVLAHLDDESA